MISKMTKYDFVLLSSDQERFLDGIQSLGMLDIKRSVKAVDDRSSSLFAEIRQLQKTVSDIENERFTRDGKYNDLCADIKAKGKELAAAKPWGSFDPASIQKLSEQGITLCFHSVPAKKYNMEWESEYPLELISDDGRNLWFVTVWSKGTDVPELPFATLDVPANSADALQKELDLLGMERRSREDELRAEKETIPALRSQIEELAGKLDLYLAGITGSEAAEGYICTYTAFAPTADDAKLCAELDKIDGIYYTHQSACTEDNPPIKLENNKLVAMFEFFTDMYGRPAYNGFDPTPYIAVFFTLFFGMCMGDAGYGFIMLLASFALGKGGFAKFAPLVRLLGISTIVLGLVFHTVFSVDLLTLEWFPESLKAYMVPSKIMDYDGTMVVAILVGIFHLCVAFTVKTIYAVKNNGVKGSLPVLGWELFLVGGSVVGALAGIGLLSGGLALKIFMGLGIVAAIFIYPFRNFNKNPLLNVGAGLWETYNTATGLLGDVLSYLRIYALALAGSMLGLAFNTIAGMVLGDGGIVGWASFVLIVIIGHTLNVAIAALGAFVHPLRLNFLEFFKNSEYDASGKIFNPLKK